MDITYSKNLLFVNTDFPLLDSHIKDYFKSYISIDRPSRIKFKNVQFDLGITCGPKRAYQILPYCKKTVIIEGSLYRELDLCYSFMRPCKKHVFDFVFDETNNSDRWEKLKIKIGIESIEWKSRGDAIIFLLYDEWDYLNPFRSEKQYAVHVIKTIEKVRKITNRRIILRAHPQSQLSFYTKLRAISYKYYKVTLESHIPLDEHLEQAYCCVVFGNSTSGVHAVLRGVPIIALEDVTSYLGISNKMESIEDLDYSIDLEKWQNTLGYSIWSIDDFESGEAWKYILT